MKVFVAGPYTEGDIVINVRNAIDVGQCLLGAGHVPFVPHLYHFWHLLFPGPYTQWTRLSLEWLDVCDVLIRLPGDSPGADVEELHAAKRNILIFHSLAEFFRHPNSTIK